jgi:uncharacterized membrane-anchored protein
VKMKQVILTVLALWGIGILTVVITQEQHLASGKEVLLKTVPIDPRDLFKGDYVILSYGISTLDLKTIPADNDSFQKNTSIFVELNNDNPNLPAKPVKLHHKTPTNGKPFITGKIQSTGSKLHVTYEDIERYYVPEGTGGVIERARGKGVLVKVALNTEGKPLIKQVLIDGKPFSPKPQRANEG